MSKITLLICAVLSATLFLACSSPDSGTNKEAMSTEKTTAASPTATKAPAATPASAEKIGVPECDAFLASYEACVNDKVPATARAQFQTSLAQWRKSWHDLAANPQTKATLATVCKTTLDQAKQSMKPYGCSF